MLYSVTEAAKMLSIGKTGLYELIKVGRLKAKKINSRTFITEEAIKDFIASLEDYPSNGMEV